MSSLLGTEVTTQPGPGGFPQKGAPGRTGWYGAEQERGPQLTQCPGKWCQVRQAEIRRGGRGGRGTGVMQGKKRESQAGKEDKPERQQ